MIGEPLHLHSSSLAESNGELEWRTYLELKDSSESIERLLSRALTGRVGESHMWCFESTTRAGMILEVITTQKMVVKIIRASRMLPWLASTFPVRAIVSIFRHPCAVISSQLKPGTAWHGATPPIQDKLEKRFLGRLPQSIVSRFGSVLKKTDSIASYLAAVWSLDTFMALQGPIRRPWLITTYEDLVEHPKEEMSRLLKHLGEPMPSTMRDRFHTASETASTDLVLDDTKAQLSKWRSRLTDEQIEEILRVVRGFGLDFYSRDLRPDVERLKDMAGRSHPEHVV
jgi:hypothetical protein